VASEETRFNYRDEIISFYYNEFVKALKNIGYMSQAPTLLELKIELLRNGFLEVVIATCFLPFFYLDHHTDDVEIAFESGEEGLKFRKKLFENPKYKETISKFFNDALYRGILH
jgi:hypothetical protein